MTILKPGSVAVITGAGLGIGRALSVHAAKAGMTVVMVDLDSSDFADSIAATRQLGGLVVPFALSVADRNAMLAMAAQVVSNHGAPSLLVNNAVTRIGGAALEDTSAWRDSFDTNFFGVVNGVDAFCASMLAVGERARIVNVGSKQGITNPPGKTIYNVAKAALKTYTEALAHDLRNCDDTCVSAHLLIPGFTTTGHREPSAGAWLPQQVIEQLFDGLARDSFYIVCPDNEVSAAMDRKRILWAATDITEDRPALSRWSGAYDAQFNDYDPT